MKVNQPDLFPVYEINVMREFTIQELSACKSMADAYAMTIKLSGLTRRELIKRSGICSQTISMMLSGERGLPDDKRERFYRSCSNLFANQWMQFKVRQRKEPTLDMFEESA